MTSSQDVNLVDIFLRLPKSREETFSPWMFLVGERMEFLWAKRTRTTKLLSAGLTPQPTTPPHRLHKGRSTTQCNRVSTAVRRISVCVWVRTRSSIKAFTTVRNIKSRRQFVQPLADFHRNSIVIIYFCSDVLTFVTIRFLTDFWVQIDALFSAVGRISVCARVLT